MGKKLSDTIRTIVESKDDQVVEVTSEVTEEIVETSDEVITEAEAPKAHPSDAAGASRMAMVNDFANAFLTMPKSSQVDFFNTMMATMKSGNFGEKNAAEQNKNSIDTKGDAKSVRTQAMKEDVAELFGDDALSEEFKEKASTLFEAAIENRVLEKTVELEEAYELKLEEEIRVMNEEITQVVKNTLDEVLETWFEENRLAVESQLKVDVVEGFLEGMKSLFKEHYIIVPDDKVDVVESLSSNVEELEAKINDVMNENMQLKNTILESEKSNVFTEVTEGLTVTQVERFRSLSESVTFDGDLDAYKRKLNIVKENYFTKNAPKKPNTSAVIVEEVSEDNSQPIVEHVDPAMQRYLEATSRIVKK